MTLLPTAATNAASSPVAVRLTCSPLVQSSVEPAVESRNATAVDGATSPAKKARMTDAEVFRGAVAAHEERQYLALIERILAEGELRRDRTGTGTRSLFAPPQLRFSLANEVLPLLTTKRVFYRGVLEELLWFVRGDTNARHLQEKNVRIWDGNASRAYFDSIGLGHREEGDLGPVYGFQWRHFGAEYVNCHTDYMGQGVDQLAEVIDKIKNNPYDRRIIMTAWNPADLKIMALPPCHMFCQFYVSNPEGEGGRRPALSCQLYQRSCDVGLGVPFNIASYAILTRMIAHVCDMDAGEFIHTMGDSHIYVDHIDALRVQLAREPRPFPVLKIKTAPGGGLAALDKMTVEDFELVGYQPHTKIAMTMSV